MTAKKSTKASGKKVTKKKRDYGDASSIVDTPLPKGFDEAISTDFLKFDEFGQVCQGKLIAINEPTGKNKSKTIAVLNPAGKNETWFISQDIEKQFELNKVKPGDSIYLKFLDVVGKRGFKKFQLGIKRGKK